MRDLTSAETTAMWTIIARCLASDDRTITVDGSQHDIPTQYAAERGARPFPCGVKLLGRLAREGLVDVVTLSASVWTGPYEEVEYTPEQRGRVRTNHDFALPRTYTRPLPRHFKDGVTTQIFLTDAGLEWAEGKR